MSQDTTPVYRELITDSTAWRRDDLGQLEHSYYLLKPETIDEIDALIAQFRESGTDVTAYITGMLEAHEEPLHSMADDAQQLRQQLRHGSGFVIIRGVPVERYSFDEACLAYAAITAFFGTLQVQSRQGEVFYSVRDEGFQIDAHGQTGVRGTKSTAKLHFHTDSAPAHRGNTPDVLGLLCLHPSKSGGTSLLVNAHVVHNIILQEQPQYLERLYQPYHFDRRAEIDADEAPTLYAPVMRYEQGLDMRYNELYILTGHEAADVPLKAADIGPLSFIKKVTNRDELVLRLELARGDIQLINNHYILHARTAFEDYPEPERKRHLIRLWLQFKPS